MADLNITVRDRFGQSASRRVVVEVQERRPAGRGRAAGVTADPPASAVPPDRPGPTPYTRGTAQRGGGRVQQTRRRVFIGQVLVEAGLITPSQLDRALEEQRRSGERLGKVIIDLGWATPYDIAQVGRASCRERV